MTDPTALDPAGRWRVLAIVAGALLLAFAPWFSASAVGPLLQADWQLGRLDLPFLTIAVQLGSRPAPWSSRPAARPTSSRLAR